MNPNLSEHNRKLFEKLHAAQVEDNKVFKKRKYIDGWNSVVNKYPETAHFIYELLQNADDARATEAEIQLYPDSMVFRHNGSVPFDIIDVDDEEKGMKASINSITSIGNSTKPDNSNTIGKFGVGFKSVFQYTKVPYIYDDNFWFKIEDFIVPCLLEDDYDGRKEGETLFNLPFFNAESAFNDVRERLESLDKPILFLKYLNKIKWTIEGEGSNTISKQVSTITSKEDVRFDKIVLSKGLEKSKLLMFTKNVDILNPRKPGTDSSAAHDTDTAILAHDICICFALTEDGKINTKIDEPIYCYFPTSERIGLPFICHAPFLLVDSRQQLKDKDPVNRFLLEKLSELYAQSIEMLCSERTEKADYYIDENLFDLMPIWEPSSQDKRHYFYDACKKLIASSNVLLCKEGKYVPASCAYTADKLSLLAILNDDQLRELVNKDEVRFLTREVSAVINQNRELRAVLKYIGLQTFKIEDFANKITPKFMNKQPHKWVDSFYIFLKFHARALWDKESGTKNLLFRSAPIIKTSTGEWKAPYKGNDLQVFLPIPDAEESQDYLFLSEEYCRDGIAMDFFKELKLRQPDKESYIINSILSKYSCSDEIKKEQLDSDLSIILDHYLGLKEEQPKRAFVNSIKDKLKLADETGTLHQVSHLQYSEDQYMKLWIQKAKLFAVDTTKYEKTIYKYGLKDFLVFLDKFGLKHSITPRQKVYQKWDLCPNYISAQIKRPSKHSQEIIIDYELPGLKEMLAETEKENVNETLSKYIWKSISDMPVSSQNWCKFIYQWMYYNIHDNQGECKSSILLLLQSKAWLLGGRRPSEVTKTELRQAGYVGEKLYEVLEFKAENPTIQELGGTDEQVRRERIGALVEKNGLTEEDIAKLAEEKKRKAALARASSELEYHRSELSSVNINEMYIKHPEDMPKDPHPLSVSEIDNSDDINNDEDSLDTNLAQLIENQKEEQEQEAKKAELKRNAKAAERYSKEWFSALIELESKSYKFDVDSNVKAIKITFASVKPEKDSKRIYVLSKPSRGIPTWIEEVEDIETTFTFSNHGECKLKFEVANVQDMALRLKAKVSDADGYAQIDWSKCTKAELTISRELQLPKKLKQAFDSLDLSDGFNLKNNLQSNVSFIFGPPGTGKTTRLAEDIIRYMASDNMHILVLAPTNTACDELTAKIIAKDDSCGWLGRFVATSREELEEYVIDRDSLLYQENKCCIISTMARLCFDGFNGIGGYKKLTDIKWDMIICDEASMIPLADIAYTIYKFKGAPIIIAGDPMQIAPISIPEWQGENIYTMVKLDKFDNPQTEPIQFDIANLETQYRSVPAIGELFSRYSYDGKLKHFRNEVGNLELGALTLAPITFISFRVDRYDSVFCPKKLDGSNVHLYSALLTVEMCVYVAKEYVKTNNDNYSIGVICPYVAQAQLIESLLEQKQNLPLNVSFTVGTVHRFQGGQCDIIIAVFNPPRGMKVAADRIFLNNKNIINVAISRAQNNLVIMLPHKDTDGYQNLKELQQVIGISAELSQQPKVFTCDEVEQLIFGEKFHIENNTFVTTHQLANVYTHADKKYEIRIDEGSVDIQIS